MVAQIHRAGPTAVAMWASPVSGIPPRRMAARRLGAVKSMGRFGPGMSIGMRAKCFHKGEDKDPMVIYSGQALKAWAEIIQDGWPQHSVLQCVLGEAINRHAKVANPCAQCRDPTEVLNLCLRTLGWNITGCTRMKDDLGNDINFMQHSNGLTQELAKASSKRWSDCNNLWRQQ